MTETPTPDLADELAAGRTYPVRDFALPLNSTTARAHLTELRSWWLDAAEGHLATARNALRALDVDGCREALDDSRTARHRAAHFAPSKVPA